MTRVNSSITPFDRLRAGLRRRRQPHEAGETHTTTNIYTYDEANRLLDVGVTH